MKKVTKAKFSERSKLKKATGMLFAGAVITTGLLGTTLAKYVSDLGTQTDQARVARWGVSGSDSELDLFKTAYAADDAAADKNTVVSADADKVIAPGTSGSVELIPTVTGIPEVAYKIVYSLKTSDADPFGYQGDWNVTDGFGWWPLQFDLTVYQDDVIVDSYEGIGKNADTGDVQLEAIKTKLDGLESAIIYPGETPTTTPLKAVLTWSWPFEREPSTDKWDTEIGNKADLGGANVPSFKIVMSAKAVQVD